MPFNLPTFQPPDISKLNQLSEWMRDRIAPGLCEFVKIDWPSPVGAIWYSDGHWTEIDGWRGALTYLSAQPERRLVKDDVTAHYAPVSDSTDIGDDKITFTFEDSDRGFASKYDRFKGDVTLEIWHYIPSLDFFYRRWAGRLDAPQSRTRRRVVISASVGNRSGEDYFPDVIRSGSGCPAIFGGRFANIEDQKESGCAFDVHLGGSVGNASAIETYGMCKQRSKADCELYLPTGFYPGSDVGGIAGSDAFGGVGFVGGTAIRGNDSSATEPLPVYLGGDTFTVHNAIALSIVADANPSNPERAARRVLFEGSIGPAQISSDVKVDGKPVQYQQLHLRDGTPGQAPTPFSPTVHNFSHLAHGVATTFGNDPNAPASGIRVELTFLSGYNRARVYSSDTVFTRQATSSRIWNLMCAYTNKHFGRGRAWADFDIANLRAMETRNGQSVQFGDKDGTIRSCQLSTYRHYHQGARATAQLIREICLWGNFLPPQIVGSKLYFVPLDKEPDLALVPVYHDERFNNLRPNILMAGSDTSVRVVRETSPRDRVYKLHVNFYDSAYRHKKRTLTIWDRDRELHQMSRGQAAKSPANYDAIGITTAEEAQYHAEEILYLGEFGQGGILNPIEIEFQIPYYTALSDGLYKGKVIRVLSEVVPRKFDALETQEFEYFRIKELPTDNALITTVRAVPYIHSFYDREAVAGPPVEPITYDPSTMPGELPLPPVIGSGTSGNDLIQFVVSY